MEGIHHLDLVVSDFDHSLRWYQGLLEPLGWTRTSPIVGERGEHVVYLGRADGLGALSLRGRQSDTPPDRYAIGLHHIAFAAPSRDVVDERAAWLRGQGATIESGPEEYAYSPTYYAVFFYDPDGIKLEIVTEQPAPGAPLVFRVIS